MSTDWTDLQVAVEARDQLLLVGLPSGKSALYFWPDDDFDRWLAASGAVGVKIVYAARVTAADHAGGLRDDLNGLRNIALDESFDDEAVLLDLRLADIVDRIGDDVIGWIAEWRHAGVAHRYVSVEAPEELGGIETVLETRAARQPSLADRRVIDHSLYEEQRDAMAHAKLQRFDSAVAALADSDELQRCTNLAQRKLLLGEIERGQKLDMEGLNREEVIAAARKTKRAT